MSSKIKSTLVSTLIIDLITLFNVFYRCLLTPRGVPHPGQGRYPLAKVGTPPGQGSYPPRPRWVPPSQGRYPPLQGLGTRRAVCSLAFTEEDFLVTARIRRMGEGNVFSLFTSAGGGVSGPAACGGGGSGPAAGGGGVRSGCWGVGQVQLLGGGQVQLPGGVRSGCRGGGGQVQLLGGGGQVQLLGGGGQVQLPGGGQHLAPSCGRYVFCVHAGGLSCLSCDCIHLQLVGRALGIHRVPDQYHSRFVGHNR